MSNSDKHALDEDTQLALSRAANLRQIQNKDSLESSHKLDELKREGNTQVKKSELAEIKGHKLEVKTKHLHDEIEPHIRKAANMREVQKTPNALSSAEFEKLKREGNHLVNKKEIQTLASEKA